MDKNSEKKVVVILGMMRSGTSFLASWLRFQGIDFGNEFIAPNKLWNEEGFFEEIELRKVLEKVKKRTDNLFNRLLINKICKVNLYNKEKQLIPFIINNYLKNKEQWGWKNPFASYIWKDELHSIFKEVVGEKNLMIIVGFRDFKSVVDSLMRVTFFSKHLLLRVHCKLFPNRYANKFLDMWIKYNSSLLVFFEDNQSNNNICFLSTIYLLNNSEIVYDKMVNFGFNIEYTESKKLFKKELFGRSANIEYKFNPELFDEATSILNKLKRVESSCF
ncbi:MAG: hypothetical protein CFE22_04775 [Cytophagaceae bacterium BCCC1]|nr:MAG: hypothetical protein CFE22_04775 [Cytophagaceae bacterium BCCC1]